MSVNIDNAEARRESIPPNYRLSRSVISAETRDKIWSFLTRAMKSKRFQRKMKGEHLDVVSDHAWIFQFIDIIYVGTITEISRIIEECGTGKDVYLLCAAYFVIMFNTRSAFDVYACISGAKGIALILAFAFYGIGVFIMTINVAVNQGEEEEHPVEAAPTGSFHPYTTYNAQLGSEHCTISYDYNIAFAAAFLLTRTILVTMYFLYFYVFHETNITGVAPAWGVDAAGNPIYSTDFRDSDVAEVLRVAAEQNNSTASVTSGKSTNSTTKASNPSEHALNLRSSSIRAAEALAKSSHVQKHFSYILLLKVGPLVLSSLVMILLLMRHVDHVSVLVTVAVIEFVGDFLPAWFISKAEDWKELSVHKHFAQERLGLFFMLVMGETVLGFSNVTTHKGSPRRVYYFLIFAFITIFSLGLQFFEQLQAYTKPEGKHPLDVQRLSSVYTWMVCLTCFFMLLASNGMSELFASVADPENHPLDKSERLYQKQKISNGVGSVIILTTVIKMLDKVYYREQLLPKVVFDWLDGFYDKNEPEHAQVEHAAATTNEDVLPEGAVGKRQSILHHGEAVPDGTILPANVSFGIRRIRPLTLLRFGTAGFMFACKLWSRRVPTENFMAAIAVLVGIPNLVEAAVELRNFVNKHRHERSDSVISTSHHPSHDAGGIHMNPLGEDVHAVDGVRRSSFEEEKN